MRIPFSRIFLTIETESAIPGLLTTTSASKIQSSLCCPSSQSILLFKRTFRYFGEIFPLSETHTSYPFFFPKSAAPTPLSPAPSTTSFFSILPNLKGYYRYYRQQYSHNPKPHDNLTLIETQFLIMVMQWRHQEYTLAFS